MTIHKSKGLEYHTVIFIGLDDGAWWSFNNDQVEATAGFFCCFHKGQTAGRIHLLSHTRESRRH
ncbi:hypothetical protein [Paraburkholderia strydomiana]|uniref:hypothetical protein n=1 Tax=Paraburkholderia strydomiana TaxID=1245417 RepID=UPI0038B8B1D1